MPLADSRFAVAPAVARIAELILSADAVDFDFAAIPQTYAALLILWYGRSAANGAVSLRFNGDAGLNYDQQLVQGSAAVAAASETLGSGSGVFGQTPGVAPEAANGSIWIPGYAGAVDRKLACCDTAYANGILTGNITRRADTVHWRSNAAIARVTLLGAGGLWRAGSRASLYGFT